MIVLVFTSFGMFIGKDGGLDTEKRLENPCLVLQLQAMSDGRISSGLVPLETKWLRLNCDFAFCPAPKHFEEKYLSAVTGIAVADHLDVNQVNHFLSSLKKFKGEG